MARTVLYSQVSEIVQLMGFFLCQNKTFTVIFRSIPISVFSWIMCSYFRLFELAVDEIQNRFESAGQVGLKLAEFEAMSVVDKLCCYIFTGSDCNSQSMRYPTELHTP
ncbi:hypothetical protein E4U56_003728 [Claviceps arundinis]|uniref:Uncharacterized protein n=1 Tax=Claviceps arundinis TaxID=1623583 RepID=A0A9P7MPE3_9HYPO|nr:hypothetical protein E4U56_003728 [Claviceps arundinis]